MPEVLEIKILKELIDIVYCLYNINCEKFDTCGQGNCNVINCENSSLDCYLIKNKIHEQSIAYKIAYKLEHYLNQSDITTKDNLSLDVEYNKTFEIQEQVNGLKISSCSEKFTKCQNYTLKTSICNGKNYFRPDIIIHSRGTNNNNIIIECKKAQKVTGKKIKNDFAKLKAFTCNNGNFKYKIGVSIVLNKTHPIFNIFTSDTDMELQLKKLDYEDFSINPTLD